MTTVINLFGGPGCGKSTTAALLYGRLKLFGINVELVREYVKGWAWSDRQINEYDPLYLLGKQSSYESALYGKVNYIVTDSPLLLAGVYPSYKSRGEDRYVEQVAEGFVLRAINSGITHKNFFLTRGSIPFDPEGRYHNEMEAKELDDFILSYLRNLSRLGIEHPSIIDGADDPKEYQIIDQLNLPPVNRTL